MPSISELVEAVFKQRRVPSATYRLQFNRDFTFHDAKELVSYFHDLGISDGYASPVLKARPGSSHGYDICDHSVINPELGGQEAFDAFAAALRKKDMGLMLDVVPNHMAITHPSNSWWMDVLENGPSSIYAPYFDIDWHPVNPGLDNKVLLPVLEAQYGTVLENGKIRLAYEDGAFFLHYEQFKLPVAPQSYLLILDARADEVAKALGEEHEHVLELQSILTALSYLPPRKELPQRKIIERNREKEIIKRRLAALVSASPEVAAAVDPAVQALNGTAGDSQSFDQLDRLIEMQAYRLAFWRVATEEINYRRFFDINELAAIRVENFKAFRDTHRLIFQLLAEGKLTGLRIDHLDGLWEPTRYFRQLQEEYVLHCVRARLAEEATSEPVPQIVILEETAKYFTRLKENSGHPNWPLYVVAEKILAMDEPIPDAWAVDGTSGYDFLNAANGLFVNRAHAEAFNAAYAGFIGGPMDFHQLVNSCQKRIMLVSMASEVNAISHQLDLIAERNRRYRDFTLNSLTFAIREIIAALAVYRTYITDPNAVSERDRKFIEEAVETAKDQNPRTPEAIFDFIRDTLLLRNLSDFRAEERPLLLEWTMKFQQLTGPVLAKGLEDTAFYIYNRLISLNEVGGHPERFGMSVDDFHRQNAERLQHWPHAMLAGSTHDTKRSEDIRARLNALSEMPDQWQAALKRWSRLTAAKKTVVEGRPAPSPNDEYLLYQILLGAWPPGPMTPSSMSSFRDRIAEYMHKATKEAKEHTSWVNPDEEYDAAVRNFVHGILPDSLDDPFIEDLLGLQRPLAFFGYFNSLSQLLLKMTCPGVPDFYQGTELWDFSLVDPDNRRPVDYQARQELLRDLRRRVQRAGQNRLPLAKELLDTLEDGRIKLYVIFRTLGFRQAHAELFAGGSYVAVETAGECRDHVCAFVRSAGADTVLVVVPRLIAGLMSGVEQPPLGLEVWKNTRLLLPNEPGTVYQHLYTGESFTFDEPDNAPGISVGSILGSFPVAVLKRARHDQPE